MTPSARSLLSREIADRASHALAASDEVRGICLLGSVARGDARLKSDIDLLVVSDRSRRDLATILSESEEWGQISVICRTPDQLKAMALAGSLFLQHAKDEGKVLYDPDGFFRSLFTFTKSVRPDVRGEIDRRADALRHFNDLDRFGGRYQFALADLYAIAKGVAIAWCAYLGQPTFVKSEALAAIAEYRPNLDADLRRIDRLRPFYDSARGHRGQSLPFDPVGERGEVELAVEAVTRLVDAASCVR